MRRLFIVIFIAWATVAYAHPDSNTANPIDARGTTGAGPIMTPTSGSVSALHNTSPLPSTPSSIPEVLATA